MGSDIALHNNVRSELGRVLGPLAPRLCVIVANGVVTMTGELDSVDERIAASSAIRQLSGVRALAVGIQVAPHPSGNP